MPDAAVDHWLMRLFPGKTLEELDGINWPRLMRAVNAGEVLRVEDVRESQIRHKTTPSHEDWAAILRHDELVGEREDNDG